MKWIARQEMTAPQDRSARTPDWLVLSLACVAQFMVVLDISIVNVALPSIKHSLGFSQAELQWVLNAYTLTFAGFLLLGGRTADLFGRRRMFLVGLGVFTLSSLFGGLAQDQAMLIAARAAQGLGGAILSPATLTILTTTFRQPQARARAMGMWSAVAGAGGAAGALLGGVLTQELSWRWILFINVPIGIAAFVGARAFLPESRAGRTPAPRRPRCRVGHLGPYRTRVRRRAHDQCRLGLVADRCRPGRLRRADRLVRAPRGRSGQVADHAALVVQAANRLDGEPGDVPSRGRHLRDVVLRLALPAARGRLLALADRVRLRAPDTCHRDRGPDLLAPGAARGAARPARHGRPCVDRGALIVIRPRRAHELLVRVLPPERARHLRHGVSASRRSPISRPPASPAAKQASPRDS